MKQSGECPKCESTEILVIDEAQIPNYEYSNSVNPLTLTAHYGAYGGAGFFGGAKMERACVGIEAYVCGKCAYTELFAKDLELLERFAQEGVGNVRRR